MNIIFAFIVVLGLIALISFSVVVIIVIAGGQKSPVDARQPRAEASPSAQPDPRSPYECIPTLLTAAERNFFAVLQQATPANHQVFAQVRLANLVQVKSWARRDKSHWWRIQAKCVDFVLVEAASFAPRLVVELDDASHNRADRRDRDAFVDDVLAASGIAILHIRWQRSYDTRLLAEQIAGRLGIAAPIAGAASLAEPAAVVSDGFWHPIAVAREPVPVYRSTSLQAPWPASTTIGSRQACGRCQAELREGAKFCGQCGALFAG